MKESPIPSLQDQMRSSAILAAQGIKETCADNIDQIVEVIPQKARAFVDQIDFSPMGSGRERIEPAQHEYFLIFQMELALLCSDIPQVQLEIVQKTMQNALSNIESTHQRLSAGSRTKISDFFSRIRRGKAQEQPKNSTEFVLPKLSD